MKTFKYLSGIAYTLILVGCIAGKEEEKTALKFQNNSAPKSVGANVNNKALSIDAFKQTVYPLVRSMSCVDCHGDSKKYQPYYAVADVAQAWQTILIDSKKINLDAPEASRIYLRIKADHHNCLSGSGDLNCDEEAATMLEAIKKWKELASVTAENSAIKTEAILFKNTVLSDPEAEYGTFLVEADQAEFPEAMVGRFISESDGKASGFKYALTPSPEVNPTTQAIRTPQIVKGNACEVTTAGMLTNSMNGPYRVSEEGTHINSDTRTSKNLIIKDGHRPFSIAVRSLLVRPDKRMDYAKMLTGWSGGVASGEPAFAAISSFALTNGNFNVTTIDVSSKTRNPGAINVSGLSLDGTAVNDVSFKTLPYFIPRDSVFQAAPDTNFINDPNATLKNLSGANFSLKNLFKLPMNEFTPRDVLNFFESNDAVNTNKFRKDLLFKFVKDKIDAYSSSANKYAQIEGMDADHFYSLYGNLKVNIKACPSGVCTATTQGIEVTAGSDTGGVALTYDNALDILKVNGAGNDFVAGTLTELQAGKAFRRIDLYVHHNVTPDSRVYGDAFSQTFYNYSAGSFTQKSKIDYPLNVANTNIDLKAMYLSGANALTKADSLNNFQNTLFPVIQKSNCIACHDGSMAMRVTHSSSNPIISFNEIERVKLVNFANPENSFRKVMFPGDAKIGHNCGTDDMDCSKTQNDFIAAINQWRIANDASALANSAQPYKELSEKERTPGMLTYKFKINKSGYYNIWTKVKSSNNFAINLRVMDGATALNAFNKIVSPTNSGTSCIKYTFPEYTDWNWFTPGRASDLTKVDALGNLKKDNNGNVLVLDDNRMYWKLDAGKTYTLQVFEAAAQTKIDMIAIDYVANHKDLLDFQPDLLARDENNISDYQKRVLKYDISTLAGLPSGSAFFKVEVKAALDGQGYIFRNPRISSSQSIAVKKIRVFINGGTSYSDATWNNIDLVAGDDQIFTFSPLIALSKNNLDSDFFQFTFEKLEKTNKTIAELDPRGSAPSLVEGRKCRELDLFLNTVKPILRNARLMLKDDMGINGYLNGFPGTNRQGTNSPNSYQCMTCHNDTHPYFKMTTFDYPEILCAQALSRVDFSNYRESLLVRGLDGSGVHPKLHFIEELQYAADSKSVVPYDDNNGTRILDGQIKNQVGTATAYFSKWIQNFYFATYTQADLGLSSTWSSNSEAKKTFARNHMGQLKRISYNLIPNLSAKTYYEPFIHDPLKGLISSEDDNFDTGVFLMNKRNSFEFYIPLESDSVASVTGRPMALIVKKDANNKILKDGGGKTLYNTTATADDMNQKLEDLKDKYRNVILSWIEKEHEHIKNGN